MDQLHVKLIEASSHGLGWCLHYFLSPPAGHGAGVLVCGRASRDSQVLEVLMMT